MKRLIAIQQKLKVAKTQINNFGGYKFRSCEDILEALKPLLAEQKVLILLNDEIVNIESRFYIKATATLFDEEGKEIAHTSAFAREEECKPKMDTSQTTGSASSYARKYALNGLFAIDDIKDSDATNTHGKEEKPSNSRELKEVTENDNKLIAGVERCSTEKDLEEYYKEISPKLSSSKARAELVKACKSRKENLNG